MKDTKYHTVGTIPKLNIEIIERCKIDTLKGIQTVRIDFFYILKVANIRCCILNLIAVEIFHNIIRK